MIWPVSCQISIFQLSSLPARKPLAKLICWKNRCIRNHSKFILSLSTSSSSDVNPAQVEMIPVVYFRLYLCIHILFVWSHTMLPYGYCIPLVSYIYLLRSCLYRQDLFLLCRFSLFCILFIQFTIIETIWQSNSFYEMILLLLRNKKKNHLADWIHSVLLQTASTTKYFFLIRTYYTQ